jgi:hypothetical protein
VAGGTGVAAGSVGVAEGSIEDVAVGRPEGDGSVVGACVGPDEPGVVVAGGSVADGVG